MIIDASVVRQLIESQFPEWADLPIEPVPFDGWDNRTFRLGQSMSVRLPSAEEYVAQVEKEQRWLPRLAPLLPLQIPNPIAKGRPNKDYPWHWSIYQWIEGENADRGVIHDLSAFAMDAANFLRALQNIDSSDGPKARPFYRGNSLRVYDEEARAAIALLTGEIDSPLALKIWETALDSEWMEKPVWLHGDFAATNMLVRDGKLSAIIDFGSCAVGDPACDLVIAWTFFSGESRRAFISSLPLDNDTRARARGWALWKAAILLSGVCDGPLSQRATAKRVIEEVLNDHTTYY
jgi:aminoglycoside phosphotransferase (APT) family kinase protein